MTDYTIGSCTFGPPTIHPPATYRLLGEADLKELAWLKAAHKNFVAYLASQYRNGMAVEIAGLCDETLDRSGRLLGEVREAAGSAQTY
jgi:hypothetical protein